MNEWYKDWFNSAEYLQVYKHRNEQDADKLLNLVFSNVKIKPESRVLDAACGAGRHSIKLAQKGYNVTGFDLSKTLLDVAAETAKEKNVEIEFVCSDIRKFYSDRKFSLIVNLFTSFGYFETDEDNFRFYENSFEMMNNAGFLVFDYFNSFYLKNNIVPKSVKTVGLLKITEKREISGNRVKKHILIEKDGNSKNFTESVKLYNANDILYKFKQIGFRNFKIFGNFKGDQFDEKKSERLIIICQR